MIQILFLYSNQEGYALRDCESETDIEKVIRYWIGKSPGTHPLDDILVITKSTSRMDVLDAVKEEQFEYEQKMFEERERANYERLKAKFSNEKP